ncbi:MAG: DegV family protein [Clostridia bacterium]|nr:DegV family protein [Clostridia bacterium]
MGIRIVTDSTCDLSRQLVERYHLEVAPLIVNFGEESYLDGEDLTSEDFFKKLRDSEDLPFTSQVNPARFEEMFQKILDDGDDVIGVFIAATFSGTYNSAVIARSNFPEALQDRIHLVDSQTSTVQMGLIVMEASKMAMEGADVDAVLARIDYCIENSKIILMMDTLAYLSKGGRLSAGQAMIGNLLNVKPILTVEGAEIVTVDKVRGRKRGLKWVVDWVRTHEINTGTQPFVMVHGDDLENLDALKEQFGDLYHEMPDYELCIGGVIGTHLGPGCVGVAYID